VWSTKAGTPSSVFSLHVLCLDVSVVCSDVMVAVSHVGVEVASLRRYMKSEDSALVAADVREAHPRKVLAPLVMLSPPPPKCVFSLIVDA
jgi:hypothetical protein